MHMLFLKIRLSNLCTVMNRPSEEELRFYIGCYTTSETRGEIDGADKNYENCFEKSREDGNINKQNELRILSYRILIVSSHIHRYHIKLSTPVCNFCNEQFPHY